MHGHTFLRFAERRLDQKNLSVAALTVAIFASASCNSGGSENDGAGGVEAPSTGLEFKLSSSTSSSTSRGALSTSIAGNRYAFTPDNYVVLVKSIRLLKCTDSSGALSACQPGHGGESATITSDTIYESGGIPIRITESAASFDEALELDGLSGTYNGIQFQLGYIQQRFPYGDIDGDGALETRANLLGRSYRICTSPAEADLCDNSASEAERSGAERSGATTCWRKPREATSSASTRLSEGNNRTTHNVWYDPNNSILIVGHHTNEVLIYDLATLNWSPSSTPDIQDLAPRVLKINEESDDSDQYKWSAYGLFYLPSLDRLYVSAGYASTGSSSGSGGPPTPGTPMNAVKVYDGVSDPSFSGIQTHRQIWWSSGDQYYPQQALWVTLH